MKRINDSFHRQDIKIPIDTYDQVAEIAKNSFNARIHHISGKPEISSTLIYLLQLGIESFTDGNSLKKDNTDSLTDSIGISREDIEDMINKAIQNHVIFAHNNHNNLEVENVINTNEPIQGQLEITEFLIENDDQELPLTKENKEIIAPVKDKGKDNFMPEEKRIEIIKSIASDKIFTTGELAELISINSTQLSLKKYKDKYIKPFFTVNKTKNQNIYTRK